MIRKTKNTNKTKTTTSSKVPAEATVLTATTHIPPIPTTIPIPFLEDCLIYEIKSLSNFYMHSEERQNNLIVRFLQFINNSTVMQSLHILIYRDQLLHEGRVYPIVRVFIASKDQAIEHVLMNSEYKYRQVRIEEELPFFSSIKGIREYATYLKITPKDNSNSNNNSNNSTLYARVYTLTALPSTLYPAWIYQLLTYSPLLILSVTRVEHSTAVSSVMRLAGMLKATQSRKLELKIQKAEQLREALIRQETALFKVRLNAIVTANNIKELQALSKSFRRSMKAQLVKFVALPFKQSSMLLEGEGKELYIELGSLAIAYPFISSDMLELEGILLGENVITKAPVIWDYRIRDNYNCLILATSGAGKSVTAKLLLARLLERYPNAYCYVIDPQGEYERLKELLDAEVLRLTEYQELGLDPFTLFDKVEVADIIADIAEAPDTIRKELRTVAQYCNSIFELYSKVSDNAKMYIIDLVEGPLSIMFKGQKSKLQQQRNILSLKGTYAGEEKVTMLLILALAKAWKQINELPLQIPKILVIDEGWMLFTMPSTARFVNLIARVGRKLNVIFIFITQRPEDVIANEYGRALLDNADTKILLRNNELAAMKIAESLQLSKEEQNMLINFLRGEALLLTREYRLRVQIKPSEEELRLFSTTPTQ
ncbi:MAG: ATP-binding protein [Candidatus Nitrosocaldaceae archaeon]